MNHEILGIRPRIHMQTSQSDSAYSMEGIAQHNIGKVVVYIRQIRVGSSLWDSVIFLGSTFLSPGLFCRVSSRRFSFLCLSAGDLGDVSIIDKRVGSCKARRTFSSSSFCFASSSAFFFSSSSFAFWLAGTPPLVFFFASLASFSSCLIRLIRGSTLSVKSTSVRRRAVSSFLRRARSDLFFFSV